MYLYDKKEDKIDIYDLIPSLKDIYDKINKLNS